MRDGRCSGCRGVRDRLGQRYCRACHAAYMRRNRPKDSQLPTEAKMHQLARKKANVYQTRGKLIPRPCEDCGSTGVQKHHPDYVQALDVVWLCRPCHLARHRNADGQPAGAV